MQYIQWPLRENRIRGSKVNHTFGMVRKYSNGNKKPHQGWDFHAIPKTLVFAVTDSEVIRVEERGAYGKQVTLRFKERYKGTQFFAFYAHLHYSYVKTGDIVKAGQLIAESGNSGNAKNMKGENQHLHFEIRLSGAQKIGRGLQNRVSPFTLYGRCPFSTVIENSCQIMCQSS